MDLKKTTDKYKKQIQTLKAKIEGLEETLRAIQSGEVDALVVHGPFGDRIFTLQSAEQPYRELVEAMNEGALTVSPDGIILYCNARFEAMTKVPHQKLVGSDIRAHICPESRAVLEDLLRQCKFAPISTEVALYVQGGPSLPVQLSVSAIELIGAEGFCMIATDLSAQKKNAVTFQQQEWLAQLLNSLPVPLVLLESNLQDVTLLNVKAWEILDRPDIRGNSKKTDQSLLNFEDENGQAIGIAKVIAKSAADAGLNGIEVFLKTSERKISVLVFCETLPAMHGKQPAKLLMFQDISLIKKVQGELTLAVQGRDQFMAALSHELRTPLNVILGWVQLLRANPDDEGMVRQALDTLERNAELQRTLIEDLLEMSRIITGNLVLESKPLDLKNTVRDCLISLQPRAEEKGIELILDFVAEPAVVLADDKRIQQLISNLVQNAIKFTPPHGKITVSIRTSIFNKAVFLTVQDTGQGIEASFLPQVFDQFKQENMSTSRAYGGLGLGLAICKTIVDQHKGQITAASEGKGRGATFTVQLPLSTNQEKSNSSLSANDEYEPLFNLAGLKVLVVDDSSDNLALFSIWLKKAGAEILTLPSASEVVSALDGFKPHVLLSDISMPGEDGYALIAKVRALPAERGGEIPAGAITANARREDRDQTLAAGYQMHIPKPVTSTGLLQAVKSLAEISKDQQH